MDDYTVKKLESGMMDRKKLHQRFLKYCKTCKPFLSLEEKAFSDGALSKKQKELMALAISIVTKCEPCMEWHTGQALTAGASDEEIYEAIDVAVEMGGGPAAAYARYALNALDFHKAHPAR